MSGVEINTFMFRFSLIVDLSSGVDLLSGWPLKRGSNVNAFIVNSIQISSILPFFQKSGGDICTKASEKGGKELTVDVV